MAKRQPDSRLCVALTVVAVLAALPSIPLAQEYPSRPIRIIVPLAPGGAVDVLARKLGNQLEAALHTPVVVDNRPGASGVVGNEIVARAPADGYTLLFASSATQIISAHTINALPYDPIRDFAPIINAGYATSVIVVNSKLPVATLGEFIAYARDRPRQFNYATSGVGSANHLDTRLFAALAGISLVHVPYRGTADGYRALLADEVQLMFGAVTSALPYVRSRKLRALAVLSDRRSPLLPGVPTIAQAGLGSVDVRKWFGFLAPAGTPSQVITILNHAWNNVLREQEVATWLEDHGFERAGGSASEFGQVLQADDVKWGDVVRRIGMGEE